MIHFWEESYIFLTCNFEDDAVGWVQLEDADGLVPLPFFKLLAMVLHGEQQRVLAALRLCHSQ